MDTLRTHTCGAYCIKSIIINTLESGISDKTMNRLHYKYSHTKILDLLQVICTFILDSRTKLELAHKHTYLRFFAQPSGLDDFFRFPPLPVSVNCSLHLRFT